MTFVTDTHAFVFYAMGKTDKLGRRARRAFVQAESRRATMYIPTVCFFELSLLLESGKLRSNMPFSEWKTGVEQSGLFVIEPLTWEDVEEARSLRSLVDPFDRLIAGTAVALGVPLVTPDARIATAERVAVIW